MATKWLILASFSFDSQTTRISKGVVTHPSYTYEARLLNAGYLDRSISVPSGLYQGADAVIRIAETDRALRDFLSHETPLRRLFTIRLMPEGGSEAAYDEFGTFEILDASFESGECTITGRDITWSWIDKQLPGLGNRTNFPWLADGINEFFFPILQGIGQSLTPLSPSSQQGEVRLPHMGMTTGGSPPAPVDRWALSQAPIVGPTAVYRKLPTEGAFTEVASGWAVNQEPHDINGIHYELNFLDFDAEQPAGTEIRVDWEGISFRGEWFGLPTVDGMGSAIRNPVDWLINIQYALLANEQRQPRYNPASFEAVRDWMEINLEGSPPTGYLCDTAITEPITAREFIGRWCTSFEVDYFVNRYGEITIAFTDETDPDRPVFSDGPVFGESTDNSLILMNSTRHRLANPHVNRLRYNYGRNFATSEWGAKEVFNNESDQAALGGSLSPPAPEVIEDRLELWFVRDEDTADDVIRRRMNFLALGSYRIEFRAPLPEVFDDIELAKLFGVTNQWGLAEGGYHNAEFKTTGLTYNLDNLECTIRGVLRVPQALTVPAVTFGGGFWAVAQAMSAADETFLRSEFYYDTDAYDAVERHLFGGIVSSNRGDISVHCYILDEDGFFVGVIPIPPNASGAERQWVTPSVWFPHEGAHTYQLRMGSFGSNGAGLPSTGSATWAALILDPELVNPEAPTKVRLTYDMGGNDSGTPSGHPAGGDGEDGTGWVNRAFDHSNEVAGVSDGLQENPNRWCPFYRLDSKWSNKVSAIYWETVHGWGGLGFGEITALGYIRLADTAPPGSAIVSVDDDFDRADNDQLDGQTASGGFLWEQVEGSFGTARIDVAGNRALVLTQSVPCSYRAEEDMDSVDHTCEADVFSTNTNNTQVVCCRFSSSAATYYAAALNRATSEILLARVVAGAVTAIDTFAASILTDGTEQNLKLSVIGDELTVYLDDALVGTANDSNITTGVRAGVRAQSTITSLGTGGFNNFRAYTGTIPPGGGGGDDFELIHASGFVPNKPVTVGVGEIRIDHTVSSDIKALMPNDEYYGASIYKHGSATFIRAKAYKCQMIVELDNLESGDTYEQPYTICREWIPSVAGVLVERRQAVDLTNAVAAYLDAWGWKLTDGGHGFKLWDAGTSQSGDSGSAIDFSEIEFTTTTRQIARSANILAQLTHGNFYGLSYETSGGSGEVTGCAMLVIVREIP